jgi:hypothetical protein
MNESKCGTLASKWHALRKASPYVVRAVFVGGSIAALGWHFFDSGISPKELALWTGLLMWLALEWGIHRLNKPPQLDFTFDESAGYYVSELPSRTRPSAFLPTTTRICIATYFERDRIPRPRKVLGIQIVGKIHCIVENKFWVWQETVPWAELEGGVFVHPNFGG